MLEVVFSGNAAGNLKLAQKRDKTTGPLYGSPADIYGFELALSVGDITDTGTGAKWFDALRGLYSLYPPERRDETAAAMVQAAQSALDGLRQRLCGGDSIRIWYSQNPDEACGYCWFLAQLNEWNCAAKVYTLKLPEWIKVNETVCRSSSDWAGVDIRDWSKCAALQQELPSAMIVSAAMHWRQLQQENAPLRAIINGQLCSVPAEFYDHFIYREIAAMPETFDEADLIGRIIGKYQLGVSDGWLALRVEEMIERGELKALDAAPENNSIYRRTLRKVR